MSEIEHLIEAVETFLDRSNWTPTRFGKEAANDPRLVFQLRNGRELRSATRQRVLSFIEQHALSKAADKAA